MIKTNFANQEEKIDILADYMTLFDANHQVYIANNVNLSSQITDLDTGSEENSTWYHLYVIYNGSTLQGLLSKSSTAPTMPTGFTHKKYVGVVYNDDSGNFREFYQHNNHVVFKEIETIGVRSPPIGSWTQHPSSVRIDVAQIVPTTAVLLIGYIFLNIQAGDNVYVHFATNNDWLGQQTFYGLQYLGGIVRLPLTSGNQEIFYSFSVSYSPQFFLYTTGFDLNVM